MCSAAENYISHHLLVSLTFFCHFLMSLLPESGLNRLMGPTQNKNKREVRGVHMHIKSLVTLRQKKGSKRNSGRGALYVDWPHEQM